VKDINAVFNSTCRFYQSTHSPGGADERYVGVCHDLLGRIECMRCGPLRSVISGDSVCYTTSLCKHNTAERIEVLLGVETGNPRNVVLDVSLDFFHGFVSAFTKLLWWLDLAVRLSTLTALNPFWMLSCDSSKVFYFTLVDRRCSYLHIEPTVRPFMTLHHFSFPPWIPPTLHATAYLEITGSRHHVDADAECLDYTDGFASWQTLV